MLDKALGWIRGITELGLAIIALGVVLQVIFGAAVPFLGMDIVGSVVSLVKQLGAEGKKIYNAIKEVAAKAWKNIKEFISLCLCTTETYNLCA